MATTASNHVVQVVFQAAFGQYKNAVEEVAEETDKLADATEEASEKTEELSEEGEKAGSKLADVFKKVQETINTTSGNIVGISGKITGAIKPISAALGDVLKIAGNIGGHLSKIVKTASGWVSESIMTFATFEDAMKQVQATMGLTGAEGEFAYQRLSEAAKEAGINTRFSATEAAFALNYLALAGYGVDEAINTLPRVLDLAAAGGLDLAYASDLVTDSMSALSLNMSELDGFTDEWARTSQRANTNIAQLGEATLTIGGTAKTLVGGTVELNTVLGVLADNGIKGSEAGTALRNVLLNLINPNEKAIKMLKKFQIQTIDAAGNLKPLNVIMSELHNQLSGLGEADKKRALSQIFDESALAAADALLTASTGRFAELENEIRNSTGAVADMAATMESGLAGSVRSLYSAYEGLQNEVGDSFSDMSKGVVDKTTGMLRELTKRVRSSRVSEIFEEVAARISAALDRAFAATINFVENGGLERILEQLGNLATTLADMFSNILSRSPSILETLARGLGWVADNIFKIAKALAAIAALKGVLDLLVGIANIVAGCAMIFTGGGIPAGISMIIKGATAVAGGGAVSVVSGMALSQIIEWEKEAQLGDNTSSSVENGFSESGRSASSYNIYDNPDRKTARKDEREISKTTESQASYDFSSSSGIGSYDYDYDYGSVGFLDNTDYDDRTAFEKAMDEIQDAFETREDLSESRISLEEARGNEAGKKSAIQEFVGVLNEKLTAYFNIDAIAESFDERNILETTRNRILTEIARLTNDIKDNVDKLVGKFNVPSEFTPLSEYQYLTAGNNNMTTRIISTPSVNMYLTVESLDQKGIDKTMQELRSFSDGIFGLDMFYDGLMDPTGRGSIPTV